MDVLRNNYVDMLSDDMKKCSLDEHNNIREDGSGYTDSYITEILDARTELFNDMCSATGVLDFTKLRTSLLNKRNITKEQLCDWLETVCCMFDSYAGPVLEQAQYKIRQLSEERAADKLRIIKLQEQVIEKKDKEIESLKSSVQSTVQTQMKSYATALSSTCSKALAPKKLSAALKTAAVEEDRSKNIVIYGVTEEKEEKLEEKVQGVLEHLGEKPRIVSCCRMGKEVADGGPVVKPIKVTLTGTDHVRQILMKTRNLRTVEGYTGVYICPDRSAESRQAHKKLLDKLKVKRIEEPGKRHYIKNNVIVSLEKE